MYDAACLCTLVFIFIAVFAVAVVAAGGIKGPPPRRFTVRSLMLFVTLCALWAWQLTVVEFVQDDAFAWPDALPVILTWLVLAAFYLKRRIPAALIIHFVGVAFFGMLMVLAFLHGARPAPGGPDRTILHGMAVLLLGGCFWGSFVSFPMAILMFLGFLSRPSKSVGDEPPGASPQRGGRTAKTEDGS